MDYTARKFYAKRIINDFKRFRVSMTDEEKGKELKGAIDETLVPVIFLLCDAQFVVTNIAIFLSGIVCRCFR